MLFKDTYFDKIFTPNFIDNVFRFEHKNCLK